MFLRTHVGKAKALFLFALAISSPPGAWAQEAGLWGWVSDRQTNQPVVAEVSIVHLAPPQVRFLHARGNATGAWEMKGLPAGEKILITRAEGYGFAWQRVVLEAGQILGPVDFALEKAATLEGQVLDELGLAVAGATVGIAYRDMPPVTFGWQTLADR